VNIPTEGGVTVSVPLPALAPLHEPLATQVAPLEVQVMVALWPTVIVVGLTEIESVAAGGDEPPPPPP
jgi:hypothetical protein